MPTACRKLAFFSRPCRSRQPLCRLMMGRKRGIRLRRPPSGRNSLHQDGVEALRVSLVTDETNGPHGQDGLLPARTQADAAVGIVRCLAEYAAYKLLKRPVLGGSFSHEMVLNDSGFALHHAEAPIGGMQISPVPSISTAPMPSSSKSSATPLARAPARLQKLAECRAIVDAQQLAFGVLVGAALQRERHGDLLRRWIDNSLAMGGFGPNSTDQRAMALCVIPQR